MVRLNANPAMCVDYRALLLKSRIGENASRNNGLLRLLREQRARGRIRRGSTPNDHCCC